MIEAHGPLRSLADGLWVMDGEWRKSLFGRRMTIANLGGGALAVHNAFHLEESAYLAIEALGEVRWILVPNRFHSSEAFAFHLRFPKAKVVASPSAKNNLEKTGCPVDIWLPAPYGGDSAMPAFAIEGTRGLGEFAFLHKSSRTLILTDLVFHLCHAPRAVDRSFLVINDIYKRFGPSRLFRFLFTKHEKKLLRSIVLLLKQDFNRVIMSHGEILESSGREALRAGFERRFPRARKIFSSDLG